MAYIGRQPVLGEIIRLNSIESSFNGSDTTFNLTRTVSGSTINFYPVSSEQLFVSLGGVIQEPDPTGNTGFKINYNQIVFAVAPAAGTSCFIIAYGNILDVGTPAIGTVTPDKLSTGGPYWDTSGNLGLGTTSNLTDISIAGLETANPSRVNIDVGDNTNRRLTITEDTILSEAPTAYGTNYNQKILFNPAINTLSVYVENSERVAIKGSNVGIGTNDPRSALDVYQGIVHLGTPGVTNGIINSADGIFINIDSDNDTTNDVLIIGKDRTGTTGGTEILRVVETGNVGIGTNDPAQLLHLAGSSSRLRIQNTSTGLAAIELIPGGEVNPYYIYIDSSRNFRIQDHSTERFRITSTGNVGIGTTDPQAKLEVAGNAVIGTDNTGLIEFTSLGDTYYAISADANNYRSARISQVNTSGHASLSFDSIDTAAKGNLPSSGSVARSANLFINGQNGNIGMGTTDVASVLGGKSLEIESSDGCELILSNNTTVTDGTEFIGGIAFQNNDTSGSPLHYAGIWAKSVSSVGQMTLNFAAGRNEYETDAPHMTIDESGLVGIGTTDPSRKLDTFITTTNGVDGSTLLSYPIAGFINNSSGLRGLEIGGPAGTTSGPVYVKVSGTSNRFAFANSTDDELITIQSGGNVGIGTDSPTEKLHVHRGDSNANYIQITNDTTGVGVNGSILGLDSSEHLYIWNYENTPIQFGTNNNPRMTIYNDGNVGIGTQTPSSKLTVAVADGEALRIINTTSSITGSEAVYYTLDYPNALATTTGWRTINRYSGTEYQILSNIDNAGYAPNMILHENKQTRIGDDCVSNRTSSGLEVSKTDGKVLALIAPTNTDNSNIDTSFYARNTNNATIEFGRVRTTAVETQANSTQKGELSFWANTAGTMDQKMVIKDTGNVGIGTNNPQQKLHVNGDFQTRTVRILSGIFNISPNNSGTITVSGLQTGSFQLQIGGYGSAGSNACSVFGVGGGYHTQTYTWDYYEIRKWTRNGSITFVKNASSLVYTITNVTSTYPFSIRWMVIPNDSNLSVSIS